MKNTLAARAALPLAAVLGLSLLGGCGSKDADNASGTAAPAPQAAPPSTMAPGPSGSTMGSNTPGPTPTGKDMTGLNGKGAGDNNTVGMPLTTMKIKNALLADKNIGATGVNVSTSAEGQVSLTGNVPTAAQRAKAEAIAKGYPGVKKVVNNLKVVPQ